MKTESNFVCAGIDENDGNATVLGEFDNSGSAREFMNRYIAKETAGNWKQIQVLDCRGECAETIFKWECPIYYA